MESDLKWKESGVESDLKELREMMIENKVPLPPLPHLTCLYDRKPDGVVAWRSDFQPSSAESAKIVATVLGHVTSNSHLHPPILTHSKYQHTKDSYKTW